MAMGLVIVDVQNDFLPGGSLAVTDGDKIISVINRLMKHFEDSKIVLTRDTHPKEHKSFASNHEGKNVFDVVDVNGIQQVLWPDHCVIGTEGCKIVVTLDVPDQLAVGLVDKGMNPEYDSYSGVKDAGGEQTGILDILKERDIDMTYVVGLATDYCVKATAIDLAEAGHKVRVVIEGIKGVAPDTTKHSLLQLTAQPNVEFVSIDAIGKPIDHPDLTD